MRQERLNLRAAAVTAVALAGLAAGGVGLHRWQVRRHAPGLLVLAQSAEDQGKVDRAVGLINTYLAFNPGDTAARARYALLLGRTVRDAKSQQVVADLFEQVLAADPGQVEVRRRLAGLYVRSEMYPQAAGHLTALKADTAPDPELAFWVGMCHDGQQQAAQAEAQYRRSLALDPKPIPRSMRLAGLLRERSEPGAAEQANQVIDQMVAANPQDATALLSRARYRRLFKVGDAADDLAAAVRLAPADLEVRLAAAELADPAAAREHLQAALAQHPRDARVYLALADLEARGANPAAGVSLLRRGLVVAAGDERLMLGLAELCLQSGDLTGAEQALAEADRWKRVPERVLLIRGRVLMAGGRWRAARDLLEAGRSSLATTAGLASDCDLLIARCCEQNGENELALEAYRRAGAEKARPEATEGAAQVLFNMGRTTEAVEQYRRLTTEPGATQGTWLMYARMRTYEYLAAQPQARRAADLEAVFEEVDRHVKGAAALLILRADVLAAEGKSAAAVDLLRGALTRTPGSVGLGLALAQHHARRGEPAVAWEVLDGLGTTAAAEPTWHAARLELLPAATDPRAAAAVQAVERQAAAAPPADKWRLAGVLADTYTRWQDWAAARRWWQEVGRLRPTDLTSRFRLFELAVQTDDRGLMEEAVRGVQAAEGADGPFGHYVAALAAVVRPADRTPARFREAREHLAAAARPRPNWGDVPAARGMVSDLENKPADALTDFLRAVELGERRPGVIRRAVQLLLDQGGSPTPKRLIRRAGTTAGSAAQLGRLAAEVSLVNKDLPRAVELAGAAIAPNSADYNDHLWQAQILARAGRGDDALAAVRRAVAADAAAGPPRVALVRLLIQAGKRTEADAEVAALGRHLTGRELLLTTAQCQDATGRPAEAAAAFRAALDAHPDRPEVVRAAVDFYERAGTLTAATPALRRLVDAKPPPAELVWARQALALAVAADPRYESFTEAVGLTDQWLAAAPDDPAYLLTKARVLASRLSHRRAALEVLDRLAKLGPLPPDADFFLGQLQDDTGNWPDGRRRLMDAASRDSKNSARLAVVVDRLIRHDDLSDAEFWLDRLEANGQTPAGVRLRAMLLAKQGRGAEAADRVRKYSTPAAGGDPVEVRRQAARIAAEAGRAGGPAGGPLADLADELYAKTAEAGQPADVLAAAIRNGVRGRVEEAVAGCRRAADKGLILPAAAGLVEIAYAHPPLSNAQLDVVDRELTGLVGRVGTPADRESLAAAMHARRGRYAEAAAAFGRAGSGPEATNNRAYMLALANTPTDEVLRLLTPLFEKMGPTAELLDTRGVVLLAAGRTPEAVADLERAVDQQPTASRCLHLAVAYHRAGRKGEAQVACDRATGLVSVGMALLPAEQAEYETLLAARKADK